MIRSKHTYSIDDLLSQEQILSRNIGYNAGTVEWKIVMAKFLLGFDKIVIDEVRQVLPIWHYSKAFSKKFSFHSKDEFSFNQIDEKSVLMFAEMINVIQTYKHHKVIV